MSPPLYSCNITCAPYRGSLDAEMGMLVPQPHTCNLSQSRIRSGHLQTHLTKLKKFFSPLDADTRSCRCERYVSSEELCNTSCLARLPRLLSRGGPDGILLLSLVKGDKIIWQQVRGEGEKARCLSVAVIICRIQGCKGRLARQLMQKSDFQPIQIEIRLLLFVDSIL